VQTSSRVGLTPPLREKLSMRRLAIALLISSFPVFAQQSPRYRACISRTQTQLQMNACASDEAARVDAQRTGIYQTLLSQAANHAEAVTKIRAAERAWVAYRDAYLDAMYPATNKQAEYGSIYPMDANLLRAKLTVRHLIELKGLLQQYSAWRNSRIKR
jgi:uncharacterized protein YecT (DUF1311 family)